MPESKKKTISERLSEFIFGSGPLKEAAKQGEPKKEESAPAQDTTFVQEAIRKTMEHKKQTEEESKKKKKKMSSLLFRQSV